MMTDRKAQQPSLPISRSVATTTRLMPKIRAATVKVEKHEARALCYDPIEYIKEDMKIQEPGVELLRKCMGSVCEDYLTFDILKAYLADEEEDLFWSQGAVEMIEKIGAQNWLIMQM